MSTIPPATEVARLSAELETARRERDSLARRCAVRFEEAETLRGELETVRAEVAAVRALHSPKRGWEREWKDPAEALEQGWPACAGCALPGIGHREIRNCPTLAALNAAQVRAGTVQQPRTWAVPGEPGPEVTRVRDSDGSVWTRGPYGWSLPGEGAFIDQPWSEVMRWAPLTDASVSAGETGQGYE